MSVLSQGSGELFEKDHALPWAALCRPRMRQKGGSWTNTEAFHSCSMQMAVAKLASS